MTEKEAQSLVDYYIQRQSMPWAVYLSLAAIVVSMGSAALTYIALRDAERRHIRVEWNGILDICVEHPQFLDITFVSNYFEHNRELSFIYEAFCYKAWSLVEFISRTRLKDESGYKTIVQWIVAYHKVWLERNPYMFISKQFWDTYDCTRDQPLAHFRPRMLPKQKANRLDQVPIGILILWIWIV